MSVCGTLVTDIEIEEQEEQEEGRSTRGRKRIQLIDDLADGKDYASLKREAEDRSVWKIRQ